MINGWLPCWAAQLQLRLDAWVWCRSDLYVGDYFRVSLLTQASSGCSPLVLTGLSSNLLFALTDGGTGGLFWGYTITVIASIFIYLSISEMASLWASNLLRLRWSSTEQSSGPRQLVGNTTGYPSFRRGGVRSISATLQVRHPSSFLASTPKYRRVSCGLHRLALGNGLAGFRGRALLPRWNHHRRLNHSEQCQLRLPTVARDVARNCCRDLYYSLQHQSRQEASSYRRYRLSYPYRRFVCDCSTAVDPRPSKHRSSRSVRIYKRRRLANDGCVIYGWIADFSGEHAWIWLCGAHVYVIP